MVVLISTVPGHCLPFTFCLFEYSECSYIDLYTSPRELDFCKDYIKAPRAVT